jgi:hypothetical protein
MTATENLIFESRQGEYTIFQRKAPETFLPLVEFQPLQGEDVGSWGKIRMYKDSFGMITLQLIGANRFHGKFVSTARLDLEDLQKITSLAEGLYGVVTPGESDSLRFQVQELQEQVDSLKLQLREATDALHVLEG